MINNGATEGTRTPDRLITNQLLYQLSYGGETLWTHHIPATTCLIKQYIMYDPNVMNAVIPPKNSNYKIL
jgi:hypothetical protein